jgi:hypothetical protein
MTSVGQISCNFVEHNLKTCNTSKITGTSLTTKIENQIYETKKL